MHLNLSAHAVRTSLSVLVCLGGMACGGEIEPGPAAGGGGNSGAVTAAGKGGSNAGGAGASAGRGGSGAGGMVSQGGRGGTPGGAGGRTGNSGGAGAAANSGELINPAPGSKPFMGANFWNIEWEGESNYFSSGVDWSTTKDPWNPMFLQDLAPYKVLRFMDWNQTNKTGDYPSNPQADWSTRVKPTDDQSIPIAYEWQIDLCNRAKKDYWVTVPHQSTADSMSKLAMLVHEKLDASLRVYVEWSNEVWNGGFGQRSYAQMQGEQLGLAGMDKAAAYQVHQSVRMFEAFEAVFGKGSPRVVKVLAGQAAWTGPCEAQLAALQDKTINPNGTKASVYAVAPYFAGTNVDELMNDGIPEAKQWIADSVACAKKADLPLIAYEGGQDSYAAGERECATLQRNAAMREVYMAFMDAMAEAKLTGPLTHYTHSGNCWGLKQKTSDTSANSPKYQGVLDWLSAHP